MNSHGEVPLEYIRSGQVRGYISKEDKAQIHEKTKGIRDAEGNDTRDNKLYDSSVAAMEVHEQRGGKLVKIRGYRIGGVFISSTMNSEKVTEMIGDGGSYPPRQMHRALEKYYGRYFTKDTPELGGMGLFTRRDIKAGDLIGIYAGNVTDRGGEYVMDIGGKWIDGRPDGIRRITLMGRINDWYWGGSQQNCKIQSGGIIVATRHIKKGEQLCMSYGSDYCWDKVKLDRVKQLPNNFKQIAEELGITQFDDELTMLEQRLSRLSSSWKDELVHDRLGPLLIQYAEGIPAEAQHPFTIEAWMEENFERWIERVVRSRSWQRRYSFENWKPWLKSEWEWVHSRREHRRHKHPRKCHSDAVDWVETPEIEELIPLNEYNLTRTTGRWTEVRSQETNEEETHEECSCNIREDGSNSDEQMDVATELR